MADPTSFFRSWSRYTSQKLPEGDEQPADGRPADGRPAGESAQAAGDFQTDPENFVPETNQDVDDEEVAKRLEDPALVSHMQSARDRLAAAQEGQTTQRPLSALRADTAEIMGSIAEMIKGLEDPLNICATSADEMYIIGGHLQRLLQGRPVEPYFTKKLPPEVAKNPALVSTMESAKTVLQSKGDKTRKSVKQLKEHGSSLSKFRTQLVQLLDNYLSLATFLQEESDKQRELLAAAAAVYNADQQKYDPQIEQARHKV